MEGVEGDWREVGGEWRGWGVNGGGGGEWMGVGGDWRGWG